MLHERKARQQQQHNRKVKQLAQNSHFSALGARPPALQAMLLPTKLPRQLSWLDQILYNTNHTASQPDKQVSSNLVFNVRGS